MFGIGWWKPIDKFKHWINRAEGLIITYWRECHINEEKRGLIQFNATKVTKKPIVNKRKPGIGLMVRKKGP